MNEGVVGKGLERGMERMVEAVNTLQRFWELTTSYNENDNTYLPSMFLCSFIYFYICLFSLYSIYNCLFIRAEHTTQNVDYDNVQKDKMKYEYRAEQEIVSQHTPRQSVRAGNMFN